MAIPIIPGGNFGSRIADAFNQGVQQLSQNKLSQLLEQYPRAQYQSSIMPIFEKAGLQRNEAQQLASFLSHMSERERLGALQNIGSFIDLFKGEAPQDQAQAAQGPVSPIGPIDQIQPQNPQQGQPIKKIAEAFKSPQERIAQEKLEVSRQKAQEAQKTKKQEQINKSNKLYLDKLSSDTRIAEQVEGIAKEMQRLLDTGKVASGFSGVWPTITQNTESQQFETLSNDLATLLASTGSGVATNFKIKLAQQRKPNLTQTPVTQQALIKRLLKEVEKPLSKNDIKNRLISENNFEEPAHLGSRIDELYKEKNPKEKIKQPSQADLIKRLGKPLENNTVIEDEGDYFLVENNQWKEVDKNDPRIQKLLGQ